MSGNVALEATRLALAADVPVLIWGEPGVGKTASIRALAGSLGWPIEIVLASLREPSDFAGLPIVVNGDVHFAPPDWARRLAGVDFGICFFDELSTAAPSVQKALLRVVHDRVVGDLQLPAGVRMIAAANPADVTAGAWDLSAPLANRFCHLEWPVDAVAIADGLGGGWPEVGQVALPDGWESGIPAQAALVAAFLRTRPQLAHSRPDDSSAAGRSWPSPRTWEAVIRVLAACRAANADEETRLALIVGLVGDGAGVELVAFERDVDLPDPEWLLADATRYERPDRDDQVHAVVGGVVDAVLRNLTGERWEQGLKVLIAAAEAGNLDIAANGCRRIAGLQPAGATIPPGIVVFGDIMRSIGALR